MRSRTRHDEMTAGAIPGTVALLERLAAGGVPLYAITNYPAETFPVGAEEVSVPRAVPRRRGVGR